MKWRTWPATAPRSCSAPNTSTCSRTPASQANQAAYAAVLQPGDTILGLDLAHGGHLTHGHKLNFSGKTLPRRRLSGEQENEQIDFDQMARLAAGAQAENDHRRRQRLSAEPRFRAFPRHRRLGRRLVAGRHGAYLRPGRGRPAPQSLRRVADIVTSTTHKTLRGPRSGLILARKNTAPPSIARFSPALRAVRSMHVIAAKAVCFLKPCSRNLSRTRSRCWPTRGRWREVWRSAASASSPAAPIPI